jgi:hypothetical protein
LPAIEAAQNQVSVNIAAVVELAGHKRLLPNAAGRALQSTSWVFTEAFKSNDRIPQDLELKLDKLIQAQGIRAAIIATSPVVHVAYALWAMQKGLHILMDKPISARSNTAVSAIEAENLQKDFEILSAARDKTKAFIVSVQRRYEPGFQHVLEQVEHVADKYGIPVTSMQATHADGQWRLPEEINNESYHGYNEGYGIVSHGGYHVADVCSLITQRAAARANKPFDEIRAFTSFIKPQGLLRQQTHTDLRKVFGKDYDSLAAHQEAALEKRYAGFGEVDATSLITFYSKGVPYNNLTINLLHNSFSRRGWLHVNSDLYNGNGRVRHEYYNIEQGPYQNIQIHSYHSEPEGLVSRAHDYKIGSNEHFDIFVFRNSKILGGKPLQIVKLDELKKDTEGLNTVEQAKHDIVREFIEIACGRRAPLDTKSDLSSHSLTATLFSLIYRSGIERKEISIPQASISS